MSRNDSAQSEGMFRAGRSLGHASSMLNHAVAERLGIHPTAWECLSLLFEYGAVPAGRLAELTGLTTGAITGLIDRLEEAGFVYRSRDPNDRRKVIVAPAPTASAAVMPLFTPMLADMGELNTRFTDDQLVAVQESLSSAAEILRKHALRLRAEARATEARGTDT